MPDSRWLSRLASPRPAPTPPCPRSRAGRHRPAHRTDPAEAVPWAVRATAAWSWRLLVIVGGDPRDRLRGHHLPDDRRGRPRRRSCVAVLLEPVATWLRRTLHFPRTARRADRHPRDAGGRRPPARPRRQLHRLAASAPSPTAPPPASAQLQTWLSRRPAGHRRGPDQRAGSTQIGEQVRANSDVLVSGVANVTGSLTSVLTGAVIAVFALFFFLKEGRRHLAVVRAPAPRAAPACGSTRPGIRGWVTLGGYARTQILVAFVDAVGISLGALILGVPLALPIGVLVFLFSFIPIVGALHLRRGRRARRAGGPGPGHRADHARRSCSPCSSSRATSSSPGCRATRWRCTPSPSCSRSPRAPASPASLGALFAVPVVAVINTVMLYFTGHDKYPHLAADIHRPGGPPGALEAAIAASWDREVETTAPTRPGDAAAPRAHDAGTGDARARRRGVDRPGRPPGGTADGDSRDPADRGPGRLRGGGPGGRGRRPPHPGRGLAPRSSALLGVPVYLKAENLQRTGSFKIRGAYLRMSRLTAEEQARGVVAACAGNHAQGVALAARELGISAP